MALVAVGVLWAGYAFICIGYDRLQSGCGPVKSMIWPQGCGSTQLHVPCSSISASTVPVVTTGTVNAGGRTTPGTPANPSLAA
jgi:hypothetical protein